MAKRKLRIGRNGGNGDSGVFIALLGILVIAIVIGIGVWFVQFNT